MMNPSSMPGYKETTSHVYQEQFYPPAQYEYSQTPTGHEIAPVFEPESTARLAYNGIVVSIADIRMQRAQKVTEKAQQKAMFYNDLFHPEATVNPSRRTPPKGFLQKIVDIRVDKIVAKHNHAKIRNFKTQQVYYPIYSPQEPAYTPQQYHRDQRAIAVHDALFRNDGILNRDKGPYAETRYDPMRPMFPYPRQPQPDDISSATQLVNRRIKRRLNPVKWPSIAEEKLFGEDHLNGTTKFDKKFQKAGVVLNAMTDDSTATERRLRKGEIKAQGGKLGSKTYHNTFKKELKYARKLALRESIYSPKKITGWRLKRAAKTFKKANERKQKITDTTLARQAAYRYEYNAHATNMRNHKLNVYHRTALHGPFPASRY